MYEQDFIIESPTEDNVDMTKPIEEDWNLKAVSCRKCSSGKLCKGCRN